VAAHLAITLRLPAVAVWWEGVAPRQIHLSGGSAHQQTRGTLAMSTEPQDSDTGTQPQSVRERTSDPLAEGSLEERADIEEDRRRQRELDDGELGGEA
jgi:hypothetical protein